EGKPHNAGGRAISWQLTELTSPGPAIGPPPTDTGQPLHAVTTLTLTQARAVRGDGKEFSASAKSIAVPVTDLNVFGVFAPRAEAGGAAHPQPPFRAPGGDLKNDGPAVRLNP